MTSLFLRRSHLWTSGTRLSVRARRTPGLAVTGLRSQEKLAPVRTGRALTEKARARKQGEPPLAILFLKLVTVFNTEQCDGLPDEGSASAPPRSEGLILIEAGGLFRADQLA